MLFLPCVFAFLGNRDAEQENASEYSDRSVTSSGTRDTSRRTSAAATIGHESVTPLLRFTRLPLIRHFVRQDSGSSPAAAPMPMQSAASRVRQTELEALQAQAVAARAHAEALAAHARAATARAEAAAEEATAAEMKAATAVLDKRQAA